MRPFFSRMVNVSSSACVGCSCAPSPALMTLALSNARKEMRRAGRAVADDDDVGVERFEIARGVLERLAFFQGGSFGGEIDDVGAQPMRGQFETDARARGRLDEKVDDGFAAQAPGVFLIARSPTALKARAVSSTVLISSAVSDSMSSRCLRCQLIGRMTNDEWRMTS